MKDGGPAFPTPGEVFTTDAQGKTLPQSAWGIQGEPGMSLRDYFAGQALIALADQPGGSGWRATEAYLIADAMLAQRDIST